MSTNLGIRRLTQFTLRTKIMREFVIFKSRLYATTLSPPGYASRPFGHRRCYTTRLVIAAEPGLLSRRTQDRDRGVVASIALTACSAVRTSPTSAELQHYLLSDIVTDTTRSRRVSTFRRAKHSRSPGFFCEVFTQAKAS